MCKLLDNKDLGKLNYKPKRLFHAEPRGDKDVFVCAVAVAASALCPGVHRRCSGAALACSLPAM